LVFGQNVLYNDSSVKEFHLVLNGKNNSAWTKVFLKANRCPGGQCQLALVEKKEVEKTERLWSDPKSWTSGKVPLAGEDVEVEPGWNMIFDLGDDSPVFNIVNVNGKLTFKNDTADNKAVHLKAHQIFVRAGELHVGSKEYPF